MCSMSHIGPTMYRFYVFFHYELKCHEIHQLDYKIDAQRECQIMGTAKISLLMIKQRL